MGRHRKPEPATEDREAFHVELSSVPVYECQHTGTAVTGGRIVCAGCGMDSGPARDQPQPDYGGE